MSNRFTVHTRAISSSRLLSRRRSAARRKQEPWRSSSYVSILSLSFIQLTLCEQAEVETTDSNSRKIRQRRNRLTRLCRQWKLLRVLVCGIALHVVRIGRIDTMLSLRCPSIYETTQVYMLYQYKRNSSFLSFAVSCHIRFEQFC